MIRLADYAIQKHKRAASPKPKTKFNMHFKIESFTALLLTWFVLVGSANALQTVEVSGRTMGPIQFKVLVNTKDEAPEKLTAIKTTVDGSLQRVNELMSTYLEDSDISKFNRSDSTDWQSVDSETAKVVARALEISELTEGAFDPTVGPAVNAWNFGPNRKEQPSVPSEKKIGELKSIVGYQTIEVRSEPPSIRKQNPKVQIDLSAIAKGYAVDRVGESLSELGYQNYMVVVGGEVTTRGERSSGGPWNVAIEKPDASLLHETPDKRQDRVIKLSNKAVATSGDYRNFYEFEGKRYSHTIDPKTCQPVEHDMAIASVIADDCMTADALATAVMVLGQEKGAAICEKLGFPLLTIERSADDDEDSRTTASSDFPPDTSAKRIPEGKGSKTTSSGGGESILPVFLATFCVFCLFVLGMAVGAIFNNKPVTGSCGGIGNMENEDGEDVCGICSKPTVDCTEPAETARTQ